ncbi:hypothetical protein [Soonwooa sp.]|uniref:hypothetical protein n=1 Tax=Soonwooa sp. TaxID=1938592 RepID=UPI0028B1505A|nr:hypothetical protein [Soonwooa sp.]
MTIQEILALIGIKIPDNNVKKITAKDVRDSFALLGEEVDDKIDKDAGNLTEPQVQHLKEVLGIGDAGIQDITAGDNITIDKSDPKNPKISASATQMVFATQSEMENQTPPDSENSKAVSLFGLWKWWAKRKLEVLLKNFTEATTIATNGQLFSITGLSDKSADSTYYKILAQDSSGKVATIDNVSRRYDGTFNPPTQAQLVSLGLRRGDWYQCTTTMQRAVYNGQQLIEWTLTIAEYNALSTDQKNAVKNINITVD